MKIVLIDKIYSTVSILQQHPASRPFYRRSMPYHGPRVLMIDSVKMKLELLAKYYSVLTTVALPYLILKYCYILSFDFKGC